MGSLITAPRAVRMGLISEAHHDVCPFCNVAEQKDGIVHCIMTCVAWADARSRLLSPIFTHIRRVYGPVVAPNTVDCCALSLGGLVGGRSLGHLWSSDNPQVTDDSLFACRMAAYTCRLSAGVVAPGFEKPQKPLSPRANAQRSRAPVFFSGTIREE